MTRDGRKGRSFGWWLLGVDEEWQFSHSGVAFFAPGRVVIKVKHDLRYQVYERADTTGDYSPVKYLMRGAAAFSARRVERATPLDDAGTSLYLMMFWGQGRLPKRKKDQNLATNGC